MRRARGWTLGALALAWCAVGAAQTPLGRAPAASAVMVAGAATAFASEGAIRALEKGAPVYSGETVSTGPGSYVNLRFTDGGFILLRPNSRLQIEHYRYSAQAANALAPKSAPAPAPQASGAGNWALFRLLRGGLRTLTGLVGKEDPDRVRVSTPVATIGIRGTDFTVIDCDAACATDPVVRQVLGALAGAGRLPPSAAGGTYVGVNDGAVAIWSAVSRKVTPLGKGQHVMVLGTGESVSMPAAPRFIQIDPPPAPNQCVK